MLQVPTREDLVVPTDHVVHTATKARLDRLDDLENQVTHCYRPILAGHPGRLQLIAVDCRMPGRFLLMPSLPKKLIFEIGIMNENLNNYAVYALAKQDAITGSSCY